MTILECLKGEANNSTLNTGNRWLYWDGFRKHWVVRERAEGRGAKCKTVLETEIEAEAVRALLD